MSLKRLVVMRHAKSDWESDAKSDHDRPLNHRGLREAPLVAAILREKGYLPDLVISSDSKRTRETWEHAKLELGQPRTVFESTLYLAGIEALRKVVDDLGDGLDGVTTVLALGHNPGWEDVVRALSGRAVDLKTAHAAVLQTKGEGTWSEAIAADRAFDIVEIVKPSAD